MKIKLRVDQIEIGTYRKLNVDLTECINRIESYSGVKFSSDPSVEEFKLQRTLLLDKYRDVETDELFYALEQLAVLFLLTKSQNTEGEIFKEDNRVELVYIFSKDNGKSYSALIFFECVDLMNEPYENLLDHSWDQVNVSEMDEPPLVNDENRVTLD